MGAAVRASIHVAVRPPLPSLHIRRPWTPCPRQPERLPWRPSASRSPERAGGTDGGGLLELVHALRPAVAAAGGAPPSPPHHRAGEAALSLTGGVGGVIADFARAISRSSNQLLGRR